MIKKKKKPKILALIPARSGSQRIKNKNIMNFYGFPLIAYSISAAIKSNIFKKIIVSTDSVMYSRISKKFGAETPFLRSKNISTSTSSDYQWIKYTLDKLKDNNEYFDFFFILRPTNPFRTHKSILRAWNIFKKSKCDSLRAVELCKQHPGKMWKMHQKLIKPILSYKINSQPSYNNQTKVLPKIYVQNASLEISSVQAVYKYKTITGRKICPFITKKFEGLDINTPEDIEYINILIKKGLLKKPTLLN